MASLGTLTVDIVARTGGFIRGMDKAEASSRKWKRKVARDLSNINDQMKRLATVGIAGIVGGFAAVVSASGKQADAIRQVETRLISTGSAAGKTSVELQKMASSLQNVTRFGDETILEMQSVLLTFTNIQGEIFDRTVPAILDLSTAMGQSLQQSAVQLGKALNDPVKGLGALSRVGIQFTEDQKDVIEALVDSGRTAEAQTVILEELERQFGGSAEAAGDTFVGALAQVKNAFGDLLENAGGLEDNKKALQELVDFLQSPDTVASANAFTGSLIGGFEKTFRFIQKTIDVVGFLRDELDAFVNGASRGDLPRLEDELESINEKLGSFRFKFATKERIEGLQERKAEIEREIQAIESGLFVPIRVTAEKVNRLTLAEPTRPDIPTPSPEPGKKSGRGRKKKEPEIFGPEDQEFLAPQETFELDDPSALSQIEAAIQAKKDQYAEEQELARKNQEKLNEIRERGQESELGLISQATSDILGVVRAFSDEQSGIYQAAFAIQKSVAVAESIIAIQAALAKAANNPFPANLAAMATVAAQTAGIIATISGTRIQGQAHDGMMSIPRTGTYMLEQGERVVPAETTAKMDAMLDEARSGSMGGIRIVNAFDMGLVSDYLGSSDGERAVLNVVRKNQRTIRNLAAV
jgi:hypothetical protein